MWYIHRREYNSAIKRNRCYWYREWHGCISNALDSKDCILCGSIYVTSGNGKTMRKDIRLVVADPGVSRVGWLHRGMRGFCEYTEYFEFGHGFTTVYICQSSETSNKIINFTVYKLYIKCYG